MFIGMNATYDLSHTNAPVHEKNDTMTYAPNDIGHVYKKGCFEHLNKKGSQRLIKSFYILQHSENTGQTWCTSHFVDFTGTSTYQITCKCDM